MGILLLDCPLRGHVVTTFLQQFQDVESKGGWRRSDKGKREEILRRDAAIRTGQETILVVEDEEVVRTLILRILRSAGYKILEAKNGSEALRVWELHKESIALIVSDVVMPGMSGRDLVEHLNELRPMVRVLFMSGYTDDAVVSHGIIENTAPFLQKPFGSIQLLEKVREVLDMNPAPVITKNQF
jgi:two-component system, cell cycle sensor histidine kinase and response regulator CckA